MIASRWGRRRGLAFGAALRSASATADRSRQLVRLTTLRGDPAKAADGVRHFESHVIPEVSKLQGFRAAVLFVDRTTGESMVVTVWDDKSDLDASSRQAAPIRTAASDVIGASDPLVEGYEVAFAELLRAVSS